MLQSLGLTLFTLPLYPQHASASLLDEYGSNPAQMERTVPSKQTAAPQAKAESNYEPNLRSNYYYPTNKKRYLPRIKRCNDAIPSAAADIGAENWEAVEAFVSKIADDTILPMKLYTSSPLVPPPHREEVYNFMSKIADDTILPMKLYTSSLLGGGTNVKVSFAKDMTKAAEDFEKALPKLQKGIKKRDQVASSKALEDLASALLAYRTAGKLLGPDGGGDIPSVDEIRRSACRVQGRSFEQKIKDRDARINQAATLTN